MPLNSSVKKRVAEKLEQYEGRLDHLYLDSKGKVTVGIGHMVPSSAAMISVTMYKKEDKATKVATFDQKKKEYETISKKKKGYRASWYKTHTTLFMKSADIEAQRDVHLDSFYSELTNIYKKGNGYASSFDEFPEDVQVALFDLIFNLGATKLNNTFPNFNKAIKDQDWEKAAKESNRPDVNQARNDFVKGLLNGVAEEEKEEANK